MCTLFLSIILMLTSCSDSSSQTKTSDRLLEHSEHRIEDSPENTKHDNTILNTGWYYILETDNGVKRQLDKSTDTFFIDPKPIVTAKNFTTFEIYENNFGGKEQIGMTMRLDKAGTEKWSIATEKAIGKQLAFILDNRLLQVAKVNAQITAGVTALNRGDYSRAELEDFKTLIEHE